MNKNIAIILLSFIFLTGCSGSSPKLGVINHQLMPCPETPNCVNSQAQGTNKKHFIPPINVISTRQNLQKQLLEILKTWQRTKVIVNQQNYIRVEFTSKIFRFVDDVEFYFPSTETEKTLIHVRSGSRIGHSDFNVNRERIEKIRSQLTTLNKE